MRKRGISKAAEELRYAPESPCPRCGRVTKTTSDGVCAECWGSKGGRAMGWKKEAAEDRRIDDIVVDPGSVTRRSLGSTGGDLSGRP
jgi:ribosomal protein L37E